MVTLQNLLGQQLVGPAGPLVPRSALRSCFMDCAEVHVMLSEALQRPPI